MTTKAIMWGDGTTDKITVTFSGSVGNSNMLVASDHNLTLSSRSATIKLKIHGATVGTLTVEQKAGGKSYSVAFSAAYQQ